MNPLQLIPRTWLAWLLVPLMALGGVRAHFCGCGQNAKAQDLEIEGSLELRSCCAKGDVLKTTSAAQPSCCKTERQYPLNGPSGEQPDDCECLIVGCDSSSMPETTAPASPEMVDLGPLLEDSWSMLAPCQAEFTTTATRHGPKRSLGRPLFLAFCSFRC
ncbi:MAG TPA: hypothetical protein EYQ25_05170 [Planctomycetes bacterium]|nr:hypothetical protein [Planctomycetota bacterium]HIL36210.1 hypothetical protein [Planctomycetota bacterium]